MSGISKSFFRAEPGMLAKVGEHKYRITHLLSVDSVLAEDLDTHEKIRLRVEALRPYKEETEEIDETSPSRDLLLYSPEEWAEAQRRFQIIKPLLENPLRTRSSVEAIAEKCSIHPSTLYKWLKFYQEAGHVAALVPQKVGRKKGTRLLKDVQEKIIESAIEDLYLNKQRHSPQDIVEEVERRCRLAKVEIPHPNTVRNRIAAINPALTLRRRGHKDVARNIYEANQGSFPGANHPLAVVQIDHTEADIILVDEVHRRPIGRPWLTLAIDVYSRMVAGIYLTFERPSATSVGMCLAHAMCPKREYLAEIGVGGEWPVWGIMNVVHSDNGKEFRGNVLRRACEDYNIDLQWRPVLLPHMGGHIERLMGVMANESRKLPGATFSNIRQRRGYDSEGQAALTLKEFETHIVDFIVNVYHQRIHSSLGVTPKRKWEMGILGEADAPGTGLFPMPEDPLRIRLDFMPYVERSIQNYGVQIDQICYYDSVLDPYVNSADPENPKLKRQFLIRRDPRDISKVYFLDPVDNRYVTIPYRNIGFPAMSLWELKQVQANLREEGRKDVDENLIFETLNRMRARVEDAKGKTKAARRQATRVPIASKPKVALVSAEPSNQEISGNNLSAIADEEDPFAMSIRPFDEVLLTR